MSNIYKNLDNVSLYEWITTSKKRLWGLIIPGIVALTFIIGAWTSYDISLLAKVGITVGAILWEGLFILEKYLTLKRCKKLYWDWEKTHGNKK